MAGAVLLLQPGAAVPLGPILRSTEYFIDIMTCPSLTPWQGTSTARARQQLQHKEFRQLIEHSIGFVLLSFLGSRSGWDEEMLFPAGLRCKLHLRVAARLFALPARLALLHRCRLNEQCGSLKIMLLVRKQCVQIERQTRLPALHPTIDVCGGWWRPRPPPQGS